MYIHACMHAYIYIHTHAQKCARRCTCTQVKNIGTCTCIYKENSLLMHTNVYVHIRTYVRIYMYVWHTHDWIIHTSFRIHACVFMYVSLNHIWQRDHTLWDIQIYVQNKKHFYTNIYMFLYTNIEAYMYLKTVYVYVHAFDLKTSRTSSPKVLVTCTCKHKITICIYVYV